jgi:hypothetical protein
VTEDEKLAEVVRTALFAADGAYLERTEMGGVPAVALRSAVLAAFECALGNRLITITDPESWPTWAVVDPPYDPDRNVLNDTEGKS